MRERTVALWAWMSGPQCIWRGHKPIRWVTMRCSIRKSERQAVEVFGIAEIFKHLVLDVAIELLFSEVRSGCSTRFLFWLRNVGVWNVSDNWALL